MRLTDEQIGAELRALRTMPSERFAAELDAWAAAGFPARPAKPSATPRRRRATTWRRLAPALGAAVVVIGLITVVLSINGSEPGPSGLSGGGADFAAPTGTAGTAAREAAPNGSVAPLPPEPGEQLKPGRERVQEKSASLSLSTDPEKVEEVSDGVLDVTDRYDGIVASSQVSTADGKGRASFDLRIPTRNLQAALADLSDLAHVSSRDQGTLDITAPFVSAEQRFGDAKAAVDRLLDQLSEADSPREVAAIRQQLRLARQELGAARNALAGLKQRADFSRVSVTVAGNGDGDGWSIGDATDDAVGILEGMVGAALVSLAVLVPLAALLALGWLGFRELQRRRREAALDR